MMNNGLQTEAQRVYAECFYLAEYFWKNFIITGLHLTFTLYPFFAISLPTVGKGWRWYKRSFYLTMQQNTIMG